MHAGCTYAHSTCIMQAGGACMMGAHEKNTPYGAIFTHTARRAIKKIPPMGQFFDNIFCFLSIFRLNLVFSGYFWGLFSVFWRYTSINYYFSWCDVDIASSILRIFLRFLGYFLVFSGIWAQFLTIFVHFWEISWISGIFLTCVHHEFQIWNSISWWCISNFCPKSLDFGLFSEI